MTADLDAITAALTESCVALRLVQTDYCLDFDAEDLRALVAELRAAREVVEAAHKWKSALTWDAEWSIRPAEVGSTLQRKSELLEALAAPAGAHVHYDDFYDPAGELDDDFDAYRAVVGPA
jgi:hypothetical protein